MTSSTSNNTVNIAFEQNTAPPTVAQTMAHLHEDISPFLSEKEKWLSRSIYTVLGLLNHSPQRKLYRQRSRLAEINCEAISRLYLSTRGGLPFFNTFPVTLAVDDQAPLMTKAAHIISAVQTLVKSSINWRNLFSYYRSPERDCDHIVKNTQFTHFCILHNGALHTLQLDAKITAANLRGLLNQSKEEEVRLNEPDNITIGALSALPRETWCDAQQAGRKTIRFADCLEQMHTAAFLVCLDEDDEPLEEICNKRFGNLSNRYFDKQIQVVVSPSQTYALFEHAGVDGTTAVSLCQHVVQAHNALTGKTDAGNGDTTLKAKTISFLVGDALPSVVKHATLDYIAQQRAFYKSHTLTIPLQKLGIKRSSAITDSHVQLAIQKTFHQMTGSFATVYEPVSLQSVDRGRLDFISSFSDAAKRLLCERDERSLPRAFEEAKIAHRRKIRIAKSGAGPINHLLSLAVMESEDSRRKGSRLQRAKAALLRRLGKNGIFLIHRDITASNGGVSNHVKSFGTIIHQPNMIGIGYAFNEKGLNMDIQLQGTKYNAITPSAFASIFMHHLREFLTLSSLQSKETACDNDK